MNVFILTDLEGIAGVNDIEYMDRTGEKYAQARRLLSRDTDLAAKTAFEAGAEKVYYLDGHGGGGNVLEELVDPRAKKCSLAEWQALMRDGKIDCLIELGSHARAGTIGGFLDHTVSSKSWFCHTVNGIEMSELSMHALLCGVWGVPVVACIGDEVACAQAKEYIPEIFVGAVKRSDCRNFAVTYDDCDEILVRTVKVALANYKSVPLYSTPLPAVVESTYYRTDMCEEVLAHCGDEVTRVNARTLRKTITQITKYEDLKF
ncbi:MAG: M55 family metallopeptidase [Clostridia bacterium]|nr:M55 family metallopeptidase [Clostridia bacterium]